MSKARNIADLGSNDVLDTSSSGIDVTGTVTSDGLTVDGATGEFRGSGANTTYFTGGDDSVAGRQLTLSCEANGGQNNATHRLTVPSGYGSFNISVNSAERLKIDNNGDISFYEDTGTTAKFFWDASAERLGIGTSSPDAFLDIEGNMEHNYGLKFTATYGTGTTFGFRTHGVNSSDLSLYDVTNSKLLQKWSGSQVIMNESGDDIDFRVESYNNTHALFVKGSDGNVGIGTSSPRAKFNVIGGVDSQYNAGTEDEHQPAPAVIHSERMSDNAYHSIMQLVAVRQSLTTGKDSQGYLGFSTIDNSNAQGIRDAGRIAIVNESGGSRNSPTSMSFWTNTGGTNTNSATERMRIDSSGRVTMPYQPRASLSHSGSVSQSGPVLTSTNFYNTTYCNIGNHFNASTGRFTCPVAGVYRIYMRYSSSGSGANVRLRKNGNTVNEVYDTVSGTSSVSSEAVVSCQTGDFLDIQAHTMNAVGGTQHKQVTFELLG